MILLIDAGNSRIKWALLQGKELTYGGDVVRTSAATKDFGATGWDALDKPDAVYVASVAGEKFAGTLTNWVKRRWKLDPVFIQTRARGFGVANAYPQPERLGVDRWLALIAAHERVNDAPVCIVDCGTAITLDVLTASGEHQGGLIVPGIKLMQNSLLNQAPGIEAIQLDENARSGLLAVDTGNAIIAGTLYSAVALIERVQADLGSELGKPLQCLLTGGDAEQVLPLLGDGVTHCPNLVFEGMAIIARQSVNQSANAQQKEKRRA